MQELIDTLEATLRQTTFATWRYKSCTPDELRDTYRASQYLSNPSVTTATPQVPKHIFTELSLYVRKLLGEFIVDDRIGSGVASLMTHDNDVSIDEFTLGLIRGSAIVGPKATARLLYSWKDSEPLRYRIQFVLWRAHFPGSFALDDGTSIMKLPNDRVALHGHVPFHESVMWRHTDIDFLNKAKVSIECEATPPLWPPRGKGVPVKSTWTARKLSGWPVDQFCRALTLSCNRFVSWRLWWFDFGDLVAFNPGSSFTPDGPFHSYDSMKTEFSSAQLTQSHFEETFNLLTKLRAYKRRVDVAIGRWNRSKSPFSDMEDQFIDLRVALEALYLKGINEELRFRIATRGAWHLGTDADERQEYYKTFQDTYRTASKVVHAGEIDNNQDKKVLLAYAQDLILS